MKIIKISVSVITVSTFLFFAVSCSKTFYTDANVNPNAPPAVTPGSLLTNIEVSLAFTQGGDGTRFGCMFTQQITGNGHQALAYYNYVINPTDPQYLWDNMYTSVMQNDTTLMAQAQTAGNTEYYAISHIIMGYSLQCLVDWWGSVPYTQALKGLNNLQPAFDADKSVYGHAVSLLNLGLSELSSTLGGLNPSADDIIYQGNAPSWYAFAQAEKARIYFHQCKLNNAFCDSAINCANSALNNGFSIARVYFGASFNNCNPLSEYNAQWGDIVYNASTLIDSLQSWNDIRDSVFSNTGSPTSYYGSCTSPVEFISPEELYFIIAECTLRKYNNVSTAQTAYTNAITASFNKLGLSGYLNAYLADPQGTLSSAPAQALVQVQQQKWAALYFNPESFASYRITFSPSHPNGVPALPILGSGIQFPRRMIYSLDEITLNPNCPSSATLFLPQVFWDTYPN